MNRQCPKCGGASWNGQECKACGWTEPQPMKETLELLRRVYEDVASAEGTKDTEETEVDTVNATRAAKVLGVSRRTVYAMLDDGRLTATGHGRARRIDLASIDIKRRELQPKRSS